MSFTDGKPRRATEHDLKARWSGGKPGDFFRCCLCGYKFQLGDYWRWQYTNDTSGAGGNPMVCEKCDGTKEEIVAKFRRIIAAYDNPAILAGQLFAAEADKELWIRRLAFVFAYIERNVPGGPIAVDFPDWWGDCAQMKAEMQAAAALEKK